MIRVSPVIMADPRRCAFIPTLQARLDRTAEVVWDSGKRDRWDTGRRAWLAVDRTASHGLVLQDDAVIPRDLVAGVEQALRHVPEKTPLCLYAGRVRPFREKIQRLISAATADTSWLVMSQLHWGVGIVLPTELIEPCIQWCDQRGEIPNYDRRIGRYLQHQGLPVWYPWPSLVDHRDSPSLVPGRGHAGRHAHRFIGASASTLNQRWDGRVISVSDADIPGAHKPIQHLTRPKGGKPMEFRSTKYPQLQVAGVRVRFRNGKAVARTQEAIDALLKLSHMGVEPVLPQATRPVAPQVVSAAGPEAGAAATQPDDDATPVVDQPPPAAVEELATPAGPDAVPDGGAREVLAWVGANPDRASRALHAEQGRDKPRSTLVAALQRVAER